MASRPEMWRLLKSPYFPQRAIHVSLSHDDLSSPCSPRCADEGTKENTQLKALLEQVAAQEGERVVVTMDAAHTNAIPRPILPEPVDSTTS